MGVSITSLTEPLYSQNHITKFNYKNNQKIKSSLHLKKFENNKKNDKLIVNHTMKLLKPKYANIINNEFLNSNSTFDVINPLTGSIISSVYSCNKLRT